MRTFFLAMFYMGHDLRNPVSEASTQSDWCLCYSLIGIYHIKTCYNGNFNFLDSHLRRASGLEYDLVRNLDRCSHNNKACMIMLGFRGGQGVRNPLKNHKNIGFLSNTVRISCKTAKLPSQHSMLGHHQHASETPFK